ncbi:MAG: hypothetical protein ACM3VW_00900, partial [Bacteroidota bacterium]
MSVVSTIIIVAVLLAWIVPLVVGIRLLRGGQRASGLVLTIIGAVWAIPSLAGLVVAGIYGSSLRSNYEIEDFNPLTYRGVTGLINTPYRGSCTLTAQDWREQTRARYVSANGSFVVPVGTYRLNEFAVSARSADGGSYEGHSWLDPRMRVEVTNDKPQQLQMGPPYTAQISVREQSGKVYMSLAVKDSGGYEVTIDQPGSAPPGFVV